jgi:outer membrane protein TolC
LLQLRQSNANLQNVLLRKGLSSKIPALAASEDVFEAKKLLASIDEELSNNIYYINILAGRGPDTPLEINHHLPPLPKSLAIPSAISSDLLARRPDLMAQIWRAKAWAYRTGAAMSAYYPDVNITALLGLESTAWRKLFEISSGTAAIKPAINLPIFTAGAIRANIRANKAEFDAAIFAYNNLLLQSTQELLEVLVFAQTIYQQKKEQNKIVYSAEQRYSLINLLQRKGLNSQFDIYGLKEEVIQKKLVDVTLLYNQYLASIKLTKALGGGYYQPLVPLVKKYDKNPEK